MLNFVVNRAPKEVVYCAFPKYLAEGEWEKFENIFKEKKTLDLEPLRRQWIADAVKTAKDPSHAVGVSSAEAKDKATAI